MYRAYCGVSILQLHACMLHSPNMRFTNGCAFPRKVCTSGFNNSFYIVEYSALEGPQLIRVPRQPEHLSASGVYVHHLLWYLCKMLHCRFI